MGKALLHLEKSEYQDALREIESKLKKGDLLYHLERGLILHYAGMYKKSNEELEIAERLRENLYTHSLTKEAAALLTSENVKPYRGEDFEDVFINYYKALNYLYLNEIEEALVECRRVDEKLQYLNSLYQHKNAYRSDAFIEFLSGLLHEMGGEYNEALVSYRRCLESFGDYARLYDLELPPFVIRRLLLMAELLDIPEVVEEVRSLYPEIAPAPTEKGAVIVLLEVGQLPGKKEASVEFPIKDEDETYWVKVAYSYYEPEPFPVDRPFLLVDGEETEMVLQEDIQAIAIKNLEDKKAREMAKAALRATTKYLAYKQAREKSKEYAKKKEKTEEEAKVWGMITGGLVNLLTYATERADTRSWLGLPQGIFVGYTELDPGEYNLSLELKKEKGDWEEIRLPEISLGEGDIRILSYRIFR